MKLGKMMRAAGIGCGDDCHCVNLFVSSLDDTQQAMLGHMIERGAEVRLDAIRGKKQPSKRRKAPLTDLLQAMSGGNGDDRPNIIDMIMSAFARKHDDLADADPYEGPLGADIDKHLADVPADVRPKVEGYLRKVIAVWAGGDPSRVKVATDNFGASIEITPSADSDVKSGASGTDAAA